MAMDGDKALIVDGASFDSWVGRLSSYLSLVENRLFSQGLHVLGKTPNQEQITQYLDAFYGETMKEDTIEAIARGAKEGKGEGEREGKEGGARGVGRCRCARRGACTTHHPARAHTHERTD